LSIIKLLIYQLNLLTSYYLSIILNKLNYDIFSFFIFILYDICLIFVLIITYFFDNPIQGRSFISLSVIFIALYEGFNIKIKRYDALKSFGFRGFIFIYDRLLILMYGSIFSMSLNLLYVVFLVMICPVDIVLSLH
jgi:hypothetical protein